MGWELVRLGRKGGRPLLLAGDEIKRAHIMMKNVHRKVSLSQGTGQMTL